MTMSPCPLGNTCSKFCVHSRAGWRAPAGQVSKKSRATGAKVGGTQLPVPAPCMPHPPSLLQMESWPSFFPRNTELLGSASSPCSERSVITELQSEGNPAAACSVLKENKKKLPLQSLRVEPNHRLPWAWDEALGKSLDCVNAQSCWGPEL